MLRGMAGGALMGLANLVPGVSGGTMLLVAGVYPDTIDAIAKLVALRFDRRSLALTAAIAGAAAVVILLLAGTVRDLVLDTRWVMYSLFLGATLGGVPVLWRMVGKADTRTWFGFALGLGAMLVTAIAPESADGDATAAWAMLPLAGFGAFAAMLLPGLSGGYVLILSGQYVVILSSIDAIKTSLFQAGGPSLGELTAPAAVLAPFAIGCLLALVLMSRAIRWLLENHQPITLGLLLGLLAGAVLGLWPFTDAASQRALPSPLVGLGALAIAGAAFGVAFAIGRLGRDAA